MEAQNRERGGKKSTIMTDDNKYLAMRQDSGRETRTVRVGAVQMRSEIGKTRENLERAVPLIENAASQGAEVIILPEMAACGYTFSKDLWEFAEPMSGRTARWLESTSRWLGVYLGTGLVEAEGGHFYNSYLLAGPEGTIVGRVRKRHAEFRYVRGGRETLAVETPLGKVGIGICADTHFADVVDHMMRESVDIMLMPHAWMAQHKTTGSAAKQHVEELNPIVRDHAAFYASIMGVPAVLANQVGPGGTERENSAAPPGYSTIADSDASVRASLGKGEGVIVAGVTMDPSRKKFERPVSYEGLLRPRAAYHENIKWPMAFYTFSRKLEYAMSLERRARAKEAAELAEKAGPGASS